MYRNFKTHLEKELKDIKDAGLYKNERIIVTPQSSDIEVEADGKKGEVLNFCANNYLGLADNSRLIAAAKKVSAISDNFVIKIPCTEAGVVAARRLEKEGIRTNVTLVFSPAQAILPAKNGSLFVSPFIGWKEANGEDCRQYIKDIVDIYKNYGFYGKTQIICAAIRTPKQIVDCAVAGADIVTTGLAVYQDCMKHAYTNQGINTFINAWDNTVTE